MENCEQAFQLHDHLIKSNVKQLDAMQGVPATLAAIEVTLGQLLAFIKEVEEKTQSKEACQAVHGALEILRGEQLKQIRESQVDQGRRLGLAETSDAAVAVEISEIRGVVKFLKWAIPTSIAVAPGVAVAVIHLYR